MKVKQFLIAALAISMSLGAVAQEKAAFTPSGKATGKVFFNYHYDMSDGANQESSFEIKRTYFGYKYQISENFTASVTFDVGKNDGGSDYSAFLKKAQLEWKMSPVVKVSLGMIGLEQFSDQEKFWGYRYIMKSFNDEYGFGPSADLGIKAKFKISDDFFANAFIINGEGYKKVQDDDGKQRFGADLVYHHKGLIAKLYIDANSATVVDGTGNENDVTATAFSAFAGYKFSDHFRIAGEYNKMNNATKYSKVADNHDREGLSFYSTYSFNKKVEIFGRYDYLTSNTLSGETGKWNLAKNGDALTTGIQYAPVKGVKMALNYQAFMHKDVNAKDNSMLFVNFEFKF
ncbi:hypothetical protein [Ancylomarina longa]|uniref:Porin n=1 Tax=Ancylomarina longa TaxID=2487017 RepID=A0A434AW04_9BACT|nr:hypothetical protein [Ancylomarina longa]RUT78676.1 hypothetical protein DLK05_07535 [Ancylomarina longa]